MESAEELASIRAHMEAQDRHIERLEHQLGVLQDKDEIQTLQYCYGFFMDNRMFYEMVDLFADEGAYMEIGGRGRYLGKKRIHEFLLWVLGDGRWGLLKDEVINHVQQQLLIQVDDDRQHARARARAEIQGNSPPSTPTFLLADGVYENTYVRENGRWKIQGLTVAMTYYAALLRERVSFPRRHPARCFRRTCRVVRWCRSWAGSSIRGVSVIPSPARSCRYPPRRWRHRRCHAGPPSRRA